MKLVPRAPKNSRHCQSVSLANPSWEKMTPHRPPYHLFGRFLLSMSGKWMYRYTRNPACRPSSPRNIMFPTRSRNNNTVITITIKRSRWRTQDQKSCVVVVEYTMAAQSDRRLLFSFPFLSGSATMQLQLFRLFIPSHPKKTFAQFPQTRAVYI